MAELDSDIVASRYVRLLAQYNDQKATLTEMQSENRKLQDRVTNGALEAEQAHARKIEQLAAAHARALAESHRTRDELDSQLTAVRAEVDKLRQELRERREDSEAYRRERARGAREALPIGAPSCCMWKGLTQVTSCAVQVAYALLIGAGATRVQGGVMRRAHKGRGT